MDNLNSKNFNEQKLDLEPLDLEPIESLDLKPIESTSEEPSTLSDFGTGVAQGATLGFSDEALGALKAVYETATTDKKFKDLTSLYREYQKIEEQKVKEAQERSPYAAIGGEVVGGLLPSLATFGTSGALGAAKAATSVSQAALKAAKAGALTGAIAGAGTSEGGLTSLEEAKTFGSDVLKGTIAGGALGAATSGAAGLGKKYLSPILETRTGRQLKTAFETPDIGSAFEKEGVKEAGKFAGEQAKTLQKVETSLGDEIENSLKIAEKEGVILENPFLKEGVEETTDFLNKNRFLIEKAQPVQNPHNFKVSELLKSENLSPLEADFLKRTLNSIIQEKKLDPTVSNAISLFQLKLNNLNNQFQKIPNYLKAVEDYGIFNKKIQETFETGISSNLPQRGGYFSGNRATKEQFAKVANKMEELAKRSEKPGTSTDEIKTQLLNIKEDVLSLEKENPELYEKINKIFNFNDFFKKTQEVADRRAASDAIRMVNPSASGSGLIGALGTTGKGLVFGAADIAGGVVSRAKKLPPSKMANKIFSADDGMLKTWADKLASEGKEKSANALLNVIQNKTGISRKAVLFSLLQKPGVREELFSVFAPESIEESLK